MQVKPRIDIPPAKTQADMIARTTILNALQQKIGDPEAVVTIANNIHRQHSDMPSPWLSALKSMV